MLTDLTKVARSPAQTASAQQLRKSVPLCDLCGLCGEAPVRSHSVACAATTAPGVAKLGDLFPIGSRFPAADAQHQQQTGGRKPRCPTADGMACQSAGAAARGSGRSAHPGVTTRGGVAARGDVATRGDVAPDALLPPEAALPPEALLPPEPALRPRRGCRPKRACRLSQCSHPSRCSRPTQYCHSKRVLPPTLVTPPRKR